MVRSLLLALALLTVSFVSAQTYFYVNEIVVQPQPATTEDDLSVDLVGGLSSTGAYVTGTSVSITGFTVTITIAAADPGGLTVIVPHTETVPLGQLPAGVYTIVLQMQGVGDFAPEPEHQFVVQGDGSPCDGLDILSIQWHAFTDTAIVVHAQNNNGSEIFDYPNFILFDANGDTLAVEIVNFFGIGTDSWHVLRVHPDATIPSAPFSGTLELWTLFTEVLACSWDLPVDLCPPAPCATLTPYITNVGGGIPIGTYTYAIMNGNFNQVAGGTLELTSDQQYDQDTVCIEPGNYSMILSPDQPPTGGAPVFGVSLVSNITGPTAPVSWDIPPALVGFAFYEPCVNGTSAIGEEDSPTLMVSVQGNELLVRNSTTAALGQIALFDAQGRLLTSVYATSATAYLTLPCTQGLLLLRSGQGTAKVMVE